MGVMASRVTMEQIAQSAGVSVATVSRVLNNPPQVQQQTRAAVYSAMKKLNYTPHTLHPHTVDGTQIIGFFAPNFTLDSVNELIRATEAATESSPYDILLVSMRGQRDLGAFITKNSPILRKIDGAIIFSSDVSDEAIAFMDGAGVPMVLLQTRSNRVRSLSNNNFLGGSDAAGHLLDCGYRKIGFVGWNPADDHIIDRLAGWRSRMSRSGAPIDESLIARGDLTPAGGYEATKTVLSAGKPDAIFFASDVLALGGMRYLRHHGLRIPDDIGVMGFDDLRVAEPLGLTTMRQFFSTKAKMAIDYLIKRISGEIRENRPEEIQISPGLVVRETTRPFNSVHNINSVHNTVDFDGDKQKEDSV